MSHEMANTEEDNSSGRNDPGAVVTLPRGELEELVNQAVGRAREEGRQLGAREVMEGRRTPPSREQWEATQETPEATKRIIEAMYPGSTEADLTKEEREQAKRLAYNISYQKQLVEDKDFAWSELEKKLFQGSPDELKARYEAYLKTEDRAQLRFKSDEELKAEGRIRVSVPTSYGTNQEYIWYEAPEKNVNLLRQILNDVENNFTQQTPTQQAALQEAYYVTAHFAKTPGFKDLGEAMFEELLRRSNFLEAYQKYYYSGDVNGVAEGFGGLYNWMFNILLRDSRRVYGGPKKELMSQLAGDGQPSPVAQNSDLFVQTAFRWILKNHEDVLKNPDSNMTPIKDRIKSFIKKTYVNNPEENMKISEESLESSALLAIRIFEATLVKARMDKLVNKKTKEVYQLTAMIKDEAGKDTDVADKAKRRRELDRLYKDAVENNVEFMGQSTQGNQNARNISKKWLFTWTEGYRMHPELIEGVDTNFRDLFSLIPNDLRSYLGSKTLVYLYGEFAPSDRYKPEENNGKVFSTDEKAAADAKELVAAITGLPGDIGFKRKDDQDAWDAIDVSKMAYNVNDLDDMVVEGVITPEDREKRLETLKKFVDIIDIVKDGKVVKRQFKAKLSDQSWEDVEKIGDPAEKADLTNRKNFYEAVFKLFGGNGDLFDFRWVDPPAQRIPRFVLNSDKLKNEFMKAADAFGRHATPHSIIEFSKNLDFMRSDQYERQIKLLENYVEHETHGGQYGVGTIKPIEKDTIIQNVAAEVNLTLEEIDTIKKKLHNEAADHHWFPLLYRAWHVHNYVPFLKGFGEFFKELFKSIVEQIIKAK